MITPRCVLRARAVFRDGDNVEKYFCVFLESHRRAVNLVSVDADSLQNACDGLRTLAHNHPHVIAHEIWTGQHVGERGTLAKSSVKR